MTSKELPIPEHFDPQRIGELWRVPYEDRARQARAWAREHGVTAAHQDRRKVALVLVDVQNTFCLPGFGLYVGGASGRGPIDDNERLCRFIYRNLARITRVTATMDTHRAFQIFHELFLVDAEGNHPPPMTQVSAEDVRQGRWRFNGQLAPELGITPEQGQRHLEHYVESLEQREKYALTVWPYHAMLGGVGHALVACVEEALFFHGMARTSQPDLIVKGEHPLTEAYSALGPEVREDHEGRPLVDTEPPFTEIARKHDAVYVAGQAKSHCVAWTVSDWLDQLRASDPDLIGRIHLLEDCTSPVVVPGVVDFTEQADEVFRGFEKAGMRIVRSTDPMI
jgi:nicotinamidase-related amidase